MLKAIIFDMDGVLIDSEYFYNQRRINFFKENGFRLDKEMELSMIGLNPEGVIDQFFPEKKRAEALDKYNDYREAHQPNFAELLDPDVEELIQFVKGQGLKVGLASSSSMPTILKVLEIAGWRSYFDLLVSGTEFPKSKPDPAIYQATLERLQVAPAEALAIEDSTHGIIAAKRAELKVIAKNHPKLMMDQSLADFNVSRLAEIKNLLESERLLTSCQRT